MWNSSALHANTTRNEQALAQLPMPSWLDDEYNEYLEGLTRMQTLQLQLYRSQNISSEITRTLEELLAKIKVLDPISRAVNEKTSDLSRVRDNLDSAMAHIAEVGEYHRVAMETDEQINERRIEVDPDSYLSWVTSMYSALRFWTTHPSFKLADKHHRRLTEVMKKAIGQCLGEFERCLSSVTRPIDIPRAGWPLPSDYEIVPPSVAHRISSILLTIDSCNTEASGAFLKKFAESRRLFFLNTIQLCTLAPTHSFVTQEILKKSGVKTYSKPLLNIPQVSDDTQAYHVPTGDEMMSGHADDEYHEPSKHSQNQSRGQRNFAENTQMREASRTGSRRVDNQHFEPSKGGSANSTSSTEYRPSKKGSQDPESALYDQKESYRGDEYNQNPEPNVVPEGSGWEVEEELRHAVALNAAVSAKLATTSGRLANSKKPFFRRSAGNSTAMKSMGGGNGFSTGSSVGANNPFPPGGSSALGPGGSGAAASGARSGPGSNQLFGFNNIGGANNYTGTNIGGMASVAHLSGSASTSASASAAAAAAASALEDTRYIRNSHPAIAAIEVFLAIVAMERAFWNRMLGQTAILPDDMNEAFLECITKGFQHLLYFIRISVGLSSKPESRSELLLRNLDVFSHMSKRTARFREVLPRAVLSTDLMGDVMGSVRSLGEGIKGLVAGYISELTSISRYSSTGRKLSENVLPFCVDALSFLKRLALYSHALNSLDSSTVSEIQNLHNSRTRGGNFITDFLEKQANSEAELVHMCSEVPPKQFKSFFQESQKARAPVIKSLFEGVDATPTQVYQTICWSVGSALESAIDLQASLRSSDQMLVCLFLQNNFQFIIASAAKNANPPIDLGRGWEARYVSLLKHLRGAYLSVTWSKTLQMLSFYENKSILAQCVSGTTADSTGKRLIKKKFEYFNAAFDKTVAAQQGLFVPDNDLRSSLRVASIDLMVPLYKMFLFQFQDVNFTRKSGKYRKYSPHYVETKLNHLFDDARPD